MIYRSHMAPEYYHYIAMTQSPKSGSIYTWQIMLRVKAYKPYKRRLQATTSKKDFVSVLQLNYRTGNRAMMPDQFTMVAMACRHCARSYASGVRHILTFFRYCSGLNIKWARAYRLCAIRNLEHILDAVVWQWWYCMVMVILKRRVGPVNHHHWENILRAHTQHQLEQYPYPDRLNYSL